MQLRLTAFLKLGRTSNSDVGVSGDLHELMMMMVTVVMVVEVVGEVDVACAEPGKLQWIQACPDGWGMLGGAKALQQMAPGLHGPLVLSRPACRPRSFIQELPPLGKGRSCLGAREKERRE